MDQATLGYSATLRRLSVFGWRIRVQACNAVRVSEGRGA